MAHDDARRAHPWDANAVPGGELAEIALFTARALQVAQGKRFIFADDSEKAMYAVQQLRGQVLQ
jgi:hypothetical protein